MGKADLLSHLSRHLLEKPMCLDFLTASLSRVPIRLSAVLPVRLSRVRWLSDHLGRFFCDDVSFFTPAWRPSCSPHGLSIQKLHLRKPKPFVRAFKKTVDSLFFLFYDCLDCSRLQQEGVCNKGNILIDQIAK